ncbi:RNA polymerase subunit sigma-24 [Flavobacterium beibuense F44-8]|uniref:RNA polymerase subunit sigma-24 n=1 Tax=Flavobacterium beibuense F44-8 TaxID=1406840 RepID=A0A0A2LIY9_9FLAO|nr:RNA polymerase sigma-70 factor [Flavobacterium beibuense]KGO79181.1 RNA polymerase subunit sigma-24 [Flavobacterium beibuense F44-8]
MKSTAEFEKIYTAYWEKLYVFSFKITQDRDLAQNIVQDIFIDFWERRSELEINSVENYLFRAAKNQIFKHYRNNRFDKSIPEEKFENYLIENITSIDEELLDKLYSLLDKLPEKRKEILIMYKIQEMDIDQIAAQLQLSKQTVKNQITSALKQLRAEMKNMDFVTALLLHLLLTFL